MNSLRWKIALWYALGLVVVLGVFAGVTYWHLRHELRGERWEREHPRRADWTLHGSYSAAEVDDIAGELARLALLYAAPVALLALGLGYVLAQRSLAPVADLNRQLQSIGARNLQQRVHLENADREFAPVEANINALVERLQHAFIQLTEFSAQVAHELRTPLTLLRLRVEEAAGRIEPELAESLQEELARLAGFVEQCLLLATAEQGRLEVAREPVALRALLEELLETYRLWAAQSDREVVLEAPGEVIAETDPRHLRQLLHNLLTNAVRHGTGPIKVTLSASGIDATCRIENRVAAAVSAPGPHRGGSGRQGMGLRIVRALAPVLGCQVELGARGDRYVAEVAWPPDRRSS